MLQAERDRLWTQIDGPDRAGAAARSMILLDPAEARLFLRYHAEARTCVPSRGRELVRVLKGEAAGEIGYAPVFASEPRRGEATDRSPTSSRRIPRTNPARRAGFPERTQPRGRRGELPERTQPRRGHFPERTQPGGREIPERTQPPRNGDFPERTQPRGRAGGREIPERTQPRGVEAGRAGSGRASAGVRADLWRGRRAPLGGRSPLRPGVGEMPGSSSETSRYEGECSVGVSRTARRGALRGMPQYRR